MTSKEYLESQFRKLKNTKYGFHIKISDGEGNETNRMELSPNRAKEILHIIQKRFDIINDPKFFN